MTIRVINKEPHRLGMIAPAHLPDDVYKITPTPWSTGDYDLTL